MIEANIPIDAIGGTSIGSATSAAYLITNGNYDKMLELFNYLNEKNNPIFTMQDCTLPVISLLSAERITNALKELFQDHFIEDLWLPYYCVSSNLNTYKENIHHSGSIFEKVRASIAIPGVLPPMVLDGEIHYDGALCNNLPVDIMRNIVGTSGKIIAISLNKHLNLGHEYNFPPILTMKDLLAKKAGIGKEKYRFPPYFDTFYNVMTFGSATREVENAAFADILIEPNLSNYSILGVKKHQEKELIKMGYRELITSLAEWEFDEKKNHFSKK